MSDALRALNDGEMQFDSVSGIDDPEQVESQEPESQELEAYEPEAAEEGTGEQPGSEEPQQTEARQPDRKGKKSSAKDWATREKRRADKAANDLRASQQQLEANNRQIAEMRTEMQNLRRQIKVESNPVLKHAQRILDEGIYKPEDIEADAARKEAQGDQEGADIARQIARAMRNLGEEAKQSQEAQKAQQAETAWRELTYGTEEFDNAVDRLKAGTEEFNQAWAFCEKNLINIRSNSQDPWDQECARQFSDPNSEFGQRLNYFLRQTAYGRAVAKHAEGILLAFDLCKMNMIMDHQAAELRKLREENEAYRGATSPSSGMPVNGNGYRPSLPNPQNDRDGFLSGFERLGTDEMRRVLRSREAA